MFEPWHEPLMIKALLAVILMSCVSAILGFWILTRKLTFAAEALTHAAFPGLVLATIIGVPLLLGGFVALVLAGATLWLLDRYSSVDRSTNISVVFSSAFSLGLIFALSPSAPRSASHILFGDLLGLTTADLIWMSALTAIICAWSFILFDRLLATSFDHRSSEQLGVNPYLVDFSVIILVCVAVLVAAQGLGNLFVAATLVGPTAAVIRFGQTIRSKMLFAFVISLGAGVSGLYISYYADLAAGATIAAMTVMFFILMRLFPSRTTNLVRLGNGVMLVPASTWAMGHRTYSS